MGTPARIITRVFKERTALSPNFDHKSLLPSAAKWSTILFMAVQVGRRL